MQNGQNLSWVEKIVHLGCILDWRNSRKDDIFNKRGKFIEKVNPLLQEFHFVSPDILMKPIDVIACNFYRSCLLDLRSKEADTTWNVSNWTDGPNAMSEHHHLKTILYSRYLGFNKQRSLN